VKIFSQTIVSLLVIALMLSRANAQPSGGTVIFANNNNSLVMNSQTGAPVGTNDSVLAGLYWAPLGTSNFTQLGVPVFIGEPLPGIFAGGTRRCGTNTPGGSVGQFQIRAWSGGFSSYEEARVYQGVLLGQSAIIQVVTGDPSAAPPVPPNDLAGFSSFSVASNSASALFLDCSPDKVIDCGKPWNFDAPHVVSTCANSNVLLTVLGTTSSGNSPVVFTRTWQAIDSCGNSNVCSQAVTVNVDCTVLALTKSCPQYPIPAGGTLAYDGTVSNASLLTISNVTVYNTQPAFNTLVFGPETLAPGAAAAFHSSYRVAPCFCGPFVDTLSVTGSDPAGIIYSNSLTSSCPGAAGYSVPGDLNGDGIVDQNELNAVLSNYWGRSGWVYMTNPASLGNGVFQFALSNASGWNFTVLVSSNLTDWTNLPEMAFPVYQFRDALAGTNAPNRYYRLQFP
jgi:hypothetical protein